MFFDRYEIHIQACLDLLMEFFHFLILISTKLIFEIYTQNFYLRHLFPKKQHGYAFQKFWKLSKMMILVFTKIICSMMFPDLFLIVLRCPGLSKDEQSWFWGPVTDWNTKKSWNLEFRASKIMKSGFHYTKMKQKKSIKLLKIIFKYNFTIKLLKMTIISLLYFPMIFLWFSCAAEAMWLLARCFGAPWPSSLPPSMMVLRVLRIFAEFCFPLAIMVFFFGRSHDLRIGQ